MNVLAVPDHGHKEWTEVCGIARHRASWWWCSGGWKTHIIRTKESTNGLCSHQRKRLIIPFGRGPTNIVTPEQYMVSGGNNRGGGDDVRRWRCFSDLSKTAAGWCAPNSCERKREKTDDDDDGVGCSGRKGWWGDIIRRRTIQGREEKEKQRVKEYYKTQRSKQASRGVRGRAKKK